VPRSTIVDKAVASVEADCYKEKQLMKAQESSGIDAAGRWALAMTLVCSVLSYMDRQVISLVVTPIKASLGLDDLHIGLLQGLAFTLCYALAGLPLALAVDRSNRVRLAGACVAFWSVSTTACGLATGFGGLLAARAATAVSEAGFSPAALSILSDKVPPARVARVSALFLLGPPLGTGLALLLGGILLARFQAHGGLVLPGIGALAPWQSLFAVIGLPGLALALLLVLTVAEPRRTGAAVAVAPTRASDGGALRFGTTLAGVADFIVPYVVGTILIILVQFAYAAWAPTFFTRQWGVASAQAGKMLGPIFIAMSIIGALSASALARGSDGQRTLERIVAIVLAGGTLVGIAATAMPLAPSRGSALVCYAAAAFGFSLVAPLATAPLLLTVPSALRGRFLAAGGALLAIVGAGGGPLLIGFVTDSVLHDEALLGRAMAIVSIGSVAAGLLVLLHARRVLHGRWRQRAARAG
jgi:MFS family permease